MKSMLTVMHSDDIQRVEERKMKNSDAVEALAEAWASIDGNLDDFRAGKRSPKIESFGGHYAGYIVEADELIERLEARGFTITELPK